METGGGIWPTTGICISRPPCGQRTIYVPPFCPPAMLRETWRVDDYEELEELYRGKASVLHAAVCRLSEIPVALKKYRKDRLSNLNWHQVEREIRIHSPLQHQNIIELYGSFEDDKYVYLVQEYAAGGDLYEELKRCGGQLGESRTFGEIIAPCLEALAYLHSMGVIHRDIKPENILLTATHVVKLADFGLSLNHMDERPVTRAGTLDYMSPEVLLCPEKSRPEENKEKSMLHYTQQVDGWAMGILAYELIVGRAPFQHKHRAETYEHIMYRKPLYVPWMSDGARGFISAALNKCASNRPSIATMLKDPWIQQHVAKQLARRQALEDAGLVSAGASGDSSCTSYAEGLQSTSTGLGTLPTGLSMSSDHSTSLHQDTAQPMDCSGGSDDWAEAPTPQEDSDGMARPQSVLQWAGASVKQLRKLLSKGVSSSSDSTGLGRDHQPDQALTSGYSVHQLHAERVPSRGDVMQDSASSRSRMVSPFASNPYPSAMDHTPAECTIPDTTAVTPPQRIAPLQAATSGLDLPSYQQKLSFEDILAKGGASGLLPVSPYSRESGPLQASGSRIKAWHRADDADMGSPTRVTHQAYSYASGGASPPSPAPYSRDSSASSLASPLAVRRGRIAGADSHMAFLDTQYRTPGHPFLGRSGSAVDPLQVVGTTSHLGLTSNPADALRAATKHSPGGDAARVRQRAAVPRSKSFFLPGHRPPGYTFTDAADGEAQQNRSREA